jgi:hypothetical protein
VIDDIRIAIGGPADFFPNPRGNFSVSLGNALGTESTVGSGNLSFSSNQNSVINEIVDFNHLDISLEAGKYYLYVAGANVEMDLASPITTSGGSLGPQFFCDPSEPGCNTPAGWTSPGQIGPLAIDVYGTVVTPEPSTLALFGTGHPGDGGNRSPQVASLHSGVKRVGRWPIHKIHPQPWVPYPGSLTA